MKDWIKELAEQTGFNEYILENLSAHEQPEFYKLVEKFANLVAAAEREACAQMFDEKVCFYDYLEVAERIRARGEQ
jgi:hypothetical protein